LKGSNQPVAFFPEVDIHQEWKTGNFSSNNAAKPKLQKNTAASS